MISIRIPESLKTIIKQSGVLSNYDTLRRRYLQAFENHLLRNAPLFYAKYRHKKINGRKANLRNPVTFNEKLLWLMLYWRHPLKTECGDKYTMRLYVQKNGWGHLLPGLIGVYDNSSEIDFDLLPSRFVLKCTHGCGFNIICTDKEAIDTGEVRRKLDKWMATDYSKFVGELHYAGMEPRIICEQFLEDNGNELPVDYKVYCFGGKAHCILVVQGRNKEGHTSVFDYYSLDWSTKLHYDKLSLLANRNTPKPVAYDEIIAAAEALSKPFPFVRMDFYSIRGKAILGEMTFTPSGCIHNDYTELAQNVLGSLLVLPQRIM